MVCDGVMGHGWGHSTWGEGGGGRRRNPSFCVPELRDQEARSTGIGELWAAARSRNRTQKFLCGNEASRRLQGLSYHHITVWEGSGELYQTGEVGIREGLRG